MKVAVLGAAGRTGRQVTEQALKRGHEVVAVVRRPGSLALCQERLVVAEADVLDSTALRAALAGAEAVISALGIGTSRHATVLYSQGTANTISAMKQIGATRLVVTSAAPAGPRNDQPLFARLLVLPILERLFGATYADMRRMEALLTASDLDWTALRPPRLLDKPAKGGYRLGLTPPARGASVTIADLATALLDVAGRDDCHRQALYIAN